MKSIDELNADVFRLFKEDWALLTAGTAARYNAMTIGWGQLGTLWNKNVVTVFVKPARYMNKALLWKMQKRSFPENFLGRKALLWGKIKFDYAMTVILNNAILKPES